MKWSAIQTPQRLLRQDDAALYVGAEMMLKLFEKAQWGQPTVKRHRCVLWDRNALDKCIDRLNAEGIEALEAAAKAREDDAQLAS